MKVESNDQSTFSGNGENNKNRLNLTIKRLEVEKTYATTLGGGFISEDIPSYFGFSFSTSLI